MDDKLSMLINELKKLIDQDLSNFNYQVDDEVVKLVSKYRENPTVSNKQKLYENANYQNYLKYENYLNYLIMNINSKFNLVRKNCAHN